MNIAAELNSCGCRNALLIERWATPWTEAFRRKGTLTRYQSDKIWAIAVVGSGWIAWMIIEPFVLDWLK
jgi:hypothetical protein